MLDCVYLDIDELKTTHILLVGLNHRSAPLTLRGELALGSEELHLALESLPLNGDGGLQEAVILSTCNRLEIYAAVSDVAAGHAAIEMFLARLRDFPPERLHPHLYFKDDEAAIVHLMRVAAGLDSMILGEHQILGQVNQALGSAQSAGAAGAILSHLFTQAVHAGKRARHETEISRHTTSVSHAAVELAREQVRNLSQARALVVGSGEMALLAAQAFERYDVAGITCINRTHARAQMVARHVNGQALEWQYLPEALAEADVIVTATSAPHTIIHRRDVEQTLAERDGRPLVFVDIALPRDVEMGVGELPGVHYYDMDDLQAFVDANVARREAAISDVEWIIAEEVGRFVEWQQGRSVAPLITALREKAAAVAYDEVEAALRRLGEIDDGQQQIVERMAHRIVNKLLHEPTQKLKAEAGNGRGPCYTMVVRDLFALDENVRIKESQ